MQFFLIRYVYFADVMPHELICCYFQGSHPYQSLSYTSGDTAADSPAHVSRTGLQSNHSPRKESLLSYLTGSFPSLHNLLEATPSRNSEQVAAKSSSLTRTGNSLGIFNLIVP